MRLPSFLIAFAGVLSFSIDTHADPLFFSSVGVYGGLGLPQVELFENPGAEVPVRPIGGVLSPLRLAELYIDLGFEMESAGTPGTTYTLRISFDQDVRLPIDPYLPTRFEDTVLSPDHLGNHLPPGTTGGAVGSFYVSPAPSNQLRPITVTIDILNSSPDFIIPSGPLAGTMVDSYSYSFFVVREPQGIPEPSTFLLAAAGVGMAIVVRLRRAK